MRAALYLRQMARESRGQGRRLAFFLSCLAVGVAAVTAVAGLTASLDQAIRNDARQLLAADLVVSGRSSLALPPALEERLAAIAGAERAEVKELVTIVAAGPRAEPAPATGESLPGPDASSPRPPPSRLVELKAVGSGYPFYGTVTSEPQRPLAELLDAESVLAAPELLAALDLAVGDTLRVGGQGFRIAGTITGEPDRLGGAFAAGPRVMMSLEGLARADLEQRGSRADRRLLLKLPAAMSKDELKALAASLKKLAGPSFRVETYAEGQPALRQGLARTDRFLGLVALVSLLAGGIGVAQTVRAWLASRMDSIAVLKCLGLTPREVFGLYLGQTALLGLAGSAAGVAVGLAVMMAVPQVLFDLVPAEAVRLWQPVAMLRGLALGTGVALLFSLPPLAALFRVPPARVLRRDAEPLPPSRATVAAALLALGGGIFALAAAQSGSARLAAGFTAGIAVVTALLAGAAFGLTRLAARVRNGARYRNGTGGRRRFAFAYGLAALARPGAGALAAIVALGLGVLVVLAMWLVEDHLVDRLQADLPKNAPSVFLVDIQPDQWPGVETLLSTTGALRIDSVPVITARLTAIDGVASGELAKAEKQSGDRRWALTREQRLTYLDKLPDDNRVVEGTLWGLPDVPELSVEREFAAELGLTVGSRLEFDVQGVPLALTVGSLRTVDWETFGINFFWVVEPGVLEAAPQQRVAAVRLPPGDEQRVQDLLVDRFPNVTVINIRTLLDKVSAVLERIGLGIQLLGGFTVLSGIAILAGAVAATAARRGREVALLKTLGLTRGGVARVFSVEYSLLGLVAGAIGAVGGGALAWVVLREGMEIPWRFDAVPFAVALAASVALAVVAGLAASTRALRQRPVEALRGE